uniref:Uncharacterized protein n=1 Tax=Anguilla anguilla TaxID=7936 RepID=A0A0E9WNR3_ANGAN
MGCLLNNELLTVFDMTLTISWENQIFALIFALLFL